MHARLRRDLAVALKARDEVAIAALRSLLAAVDNAGARPAEHRSGTGEHVAGAARGAGATEVHRLSLTATDLSGLVETEVAERTGAATEYERLGRPDLAGRLRAEADLLRRYRHTE